MTLEFVRFESTDEVQLQGWISNVDSDTAVLHIHGMGGNGYENNFLDNLRELYTQKNMSFFTIDTRGRGIISDFRQGDGWKHAGSCFEIFEESAYDIKGALDYLKALGKTKFILQGHSLGCSKVVHYILNEDTAGIEKIILLAPTDMIGWASADSEHAENLQKAAALLAEGKGKELIGAQCWRLDETPLSAQAYYSKSAPGSAVDIYSQRDGGALLGNVELPMHIVYGTQDVGITDIDGSIEKYSERVNKMKNNNTDITVIADAEHGFRNYENQLTEVIRGFLG